MLEALSAEALKMRSHKATWFLVWLFPIAFTIITLIVIGAGMIGVDKPEQPNAADWIENTTMIWFVPNNAVGRYLLSAFVAVVFAGEYGWNTWKLIIPHRARATLIAAKYAVALALLALGFALGAMVFNLIGWAEDVLTGDRIPPGIGLGALATAHGLGALAAIAPLLLTTAYVSLAAILTRSTVAALMIGFAITTAEQLFRTFAPLLEPYAPGLIGALYRALPGYHVVNVGSWITTGEAVVAPFVSGPYSAPFAVSLAIVGGWVVLLVGLTFWRFGRQDIN